jgi:hypothetical protein
MQLKNMVDIVFTMYATPLLSHLLLLLNGRFRKWTPFNRHSPDGRWGRFTVLFYSQVFLPLPGPVGHTQ